jgi:N-acetylglucosamine-6-phosphate deacetylase
MRIDVPGFVDLQVNGFAGVDFNSPALTSDEFLRGCAAIRATGVTRFLPTLITSDLDTFSILARLIVDVADPGVAGIHMEGPYICADDGPRGAHPRACVRAASRDDFDRRQDAARGRIVLVTLAPEASGALELMEYLAGAGVRVAIAHSGASPEQVRAAVDAGATLSTHLGNGCAATLPRHPNLIWEQLATDELLASVIVDGHHLPPATVKAMVRAKTPDRTILVTDAMAAAACDPGTYRIGGAQVDLSADGRVSLTGTPYLAGSALAMPDAIANTVRFTGLALSEVVPMATTRPAEYIGISCAGTVRAEWDADRCVLSVIDVATDEGAA